MFAELRGVYSSVALDERPYQAGFGAADVLLYYPFFEKQSDLHDQLARCAWYLHQLEHKCVVFVLDGISPSLAQVPGMDGRVWARLQSMLEQGRIRFVDANDTKTVVDAYSAASEVLRWQASTKEADQRSIASLGAGDDRKIWTVDKTTNRMEGSFYIEVGYQQHLREEPEAYAENVRLAHARFRRLVDSLEGLPTNIICTGPSSDSFKTFDFSGTQSVVCNSAVKNFELLEHTNARVVCFADPVFHFGCSEYAGCFRQSLVEAVNEFDLTAIIPYKYYQLALSTMPEIADALIPIPMEPKRSINLGLVDDFSVKTTDNILTLLLLPVASSLSDDIRLMGCDGRRREDNGYFWSHGNKVQFVDKMSTVREVHPSFFETSYDDYYDRHEQNLEDYIETGREAGIRFESLTPSFLGPIARLSNVIAQDIKNVAGRTDQETLFISIVPELRGTFGHFASAERQLASALDADSEGHVVIGAVEADLDVLGMNVVRAFSCTSGGLLAQPSDPEQGRRRQEAYVEELSRVLTELERAFPKRRMVFSHYSGSWVHALCLVRAIARSGFSSGRFFVNLFFSHTETTVAVSENRGELYAALREILELSGLEDVVRLTTDSEELQTFLRESYGLDTFLWKHFFRTVDGAIPSDGKIRKQLNVVFPSNPQQAKGYDLFASLAQAVAGTPLSERVRFVARELYLEHTAPQMKAFANSMRKHARLVQGVLSDDAYIDLLSEADILLTPYRWRSFHSRTSGIFSDALSRGVPLVTTADTWAGTRVEALGSGATFPDGDLEGMRRALQKVVDDYDAYCARAIDARGRWFDEHNPETFASTLRREVERMEEQGAVRGCAPGVERCARLALSHDLTLRALRQARRPGASARQLVRIDQGTLKGVGRKVLRLVDRYATPDLSRRVRTVCKRGFSVALSAQRRLRTIRRVLPLRSS